MSADSSGLHMRCPGGRWPEAALRDVRWLRASLQSDELIARGFAGRTPTGWSLPAEQIDAALAEGFTLPLLWSGWNPLRLRVGATVGQGGHLHLEWAFRAGGRMVSVERCGRYMRRTPGAGETFLLDANTSLLLDVLETLSSRPPVHAADRLQATAWLRDAGEEVGAELFGCLATGVSRAHHHDADSLADEAWQMQSEGLSYAEFLRLSPALLDASVAALYQHGGYQVALLPSGNGFGAAVVARNGGKFEIAFVDTREGGPTLEEILAAESSLRGALGRSGLRSTVFSRAELSHAARTQLIRRGIEVHSGRQFAERLRSRGVNPAIAKTWLQYRCRTFADSIRTLLEVT